MRQSCAQWQESIVDLAEGRRSADAEAHVHGCPACQKKLRELQTAIRSIGVPVTEVPEALSLAAVSLFKPKWVPARLLQRVSNPAGARSDNTVFQLVLDLSGIQVRTVYLPEGDDKWRVTGRATAQGIATRDGESVNEDPERFSFEANRLEDTGFDFMANETLFRVQPASEYLRESSEPGD